MTENPAYQSVMRKLEELRARYETITDQMNQPEIASDPLRIVELAREHGQLKRIMEPYEAYRKAIDDIAQSESLLADASSDAEMRELATEECASARTKAGELMALIQEALVIGDDADISSIIMEIRAGTGGVEAALFVRDLYEMYVRYCERRRFSVEVLDSSPSDLGGFKEIVLNIKGLGVYQCLGYEGGGHRVQRVPETEAQGRIHTSAATVAVLPEPQEVDVKIDWDREVVEHVSRAGGPGGQNVNKVSSAIRLEHLPTGITVSMRDEKSQHKNRAKARRILLSRIYDNIVHTQRSERDSARRNMIGSGDRSQRIRTYNFPQNRCTDHRIGMDLYSLDQVMQGELDELIQALQEHDRHERLKQL